MRCPPANCHTHGLESEKGLIATVYRSAEKNKTLEESCLNRRGGVQWPRSKKVGTWSPRRVPQRGPQHTPNGLIYDFRDSHFSDCNKELTAPVNCNIRVIAGCKPCFDVLETLHDTVRRSGDCSKNPDSGGNGVASIGSYADIGIRFIMPSFKLCRVVIVRVAIAGLSDGMARHNPGINSDRQGRKLVALVMELLSGIRWETLPRE